MIDNKPEILKEIEQHRHELCLYLMEPYELLGFHEDDDDYYYEVLNSKAQIEYLSCVGGFIYLKDKLTLEEYINLEGFWRLNVRDRKAYIDKIKEEGRGSISYKKGQKFWIELEAQSDGDISIDNPILANMVFGEAKIENFKIPNFIMNLNGYVDKKLIDEMDAIVQKFKEI